jgi:hypothetical protein
VPYPTKRNSSFTSLRTTGDDKMMKKTMEIKFHSMTILNVIACNLNWIKIHWFEFELKFSKMQIDVESIIIFFIISIIHDYGVENKQ